MKRTGGVCWRAFILIVLCVPIMAEADGPPTQTEGSPAGSEEGYVVKKGDTLWGISKDLLQDPLLWPRLWEQNRFIADPNLIFPGDRLSLPGKELVPAPVAESPTPEPPPATAEAPPAPPAPPQEAPKPLPPPVAAPAPPPPPAPLVRVPEPPVPMVPLATIACSPVLTTEQRVERVAVGSIVRSVDNRNLISTEDLVAVGLSADLPLKPGDRLAVVRPAQRLIHPRTGLPISRVLYVLGLIEVGEAKDRVVLGRVSYSCGAMSLGDFVIPYTPVQFPIDKIAQPTQRSVEGVILDSLRGERLVGQQQVVFLNVGIAQGVGSGDVFAIYRPTPPVENAAGTVFNIPPVRLGEAVIIRYTDQTATAVVTTSALEVRIGDQVVLSRQMAP